ncbi:MAG TPA: molybdopterin-dependent oxidoreductase, partial [Nitrospiraceae bacterium]
NRIDPASWRLSVKGLVARELSLSLSDLARFEEVSVTAVVQCSGNGAGPLGAGLIPPPRNFTCGSTMKDITDGQLFWVIKHGSPGTGMMPFSGLSDDEVWQLIHYLRSLAR